nr:MAG TPA: hypothetical protein [Caudoviricetes sp.]
MIFFITLYSGIVWQLYERTFIYKILKNFTKKGIDKVIMMKYNIIKDRE